MSRERNLESIKYLQQIQDLIRRPPTVCSVPLPVDGFRTIEEAVYLCTNYRKFIDSKALNCGFIEPATESISDVSRSFHSGFNTPGKTHGRPGSHGGVSSQWLALQRSNSLKGTSRTDSPSLHASYSLENRQISATLQNGSPSMQHMSQRDIRSVRSNVSDIASVQSNEDTASVHGDILTSRQIEDASDFIASIVSSLSSNTALDDLQRSRGGTAAQPSCQSNALAALESHDDQLDDEDSDVGQSPWKTVPEQLPKTRSLLVPPQGLQEDHDM